jgi:PAS domain S-box-containing protein
VSSDVRAICIPSSDHAFAAAVQAALADGDVDVPGDLEQRVRPWAPNVVVRSRELSGESGGTWYVYRDGRFAAEQDDGWHRAPDTPWARFDATTGAVLEANDSFADLVGYQTDGVVGCPYQDFVFPDAAGLANRVYAEIIRSGHARSVVQLRRRDGAGVPVEYVARAGDGSVEGWYRPITLVPGVGTR